MRQVSCGHRQCQRGSYDRRGLFGLPKGHIQCRGLTKLCGVPAWHLQRHPWSSDHSFLPSLRAWLLQRRRRIQLRPLPCWDRQPRVRCHHGRSVRALPRRLLERRQPGQLHHVPIGAGVLRDWWHFRGRMLALPGGLLEPGRRELLQPLRCRDGQPGGGRHHSCFLSGLPPGLLR